MREGLGFMVKDAGFRDWAVGFFCGRNREYCLAERGCPASKPETRICQLCSRCEHTEEPHILNPELDS